MAYPVVLLDLDHTLLDSDASLLLGFGDAMRAVDADPTGHYQTFDEINRALWRSVERGEIKPQQVHIARFEQLIKRMDLAAEAQTMADAFATGLGQHGELYDGAIDLLDKLAALSTLAMVTNGLSDIQRRRVERLDIGRYFDAIIISAEVDAVKPSPAIFEIAFEALGHPDRGDALMVGDNLGSDIAGGNNYGISTCWYNPHGAAREPKHPATYEIANLADLVAIVSA